MRACCKVIIVHASCALTCYLSRHRGSSTNSSSYPYRTCHSGKENNSPGGSYSKSSFCIAPSIICKDISEIHSHVDKDTPTIKSIKELLSCRDSFFFNTSTSVNSQFHPPCSQKHRVHPQLKLQWSRKHPIRSLIKLWVMIPFLICATVLILILCRLQQLSAPSCFVPSSTSVTRPEM